MTIQPGTFYLVVLGEDPDGYIQRLLATEATQFLEIKDFVSFAQGKKPEAVITTVEDALRELAPMMLFLTQVFSTKAPWKLPSSPLPMTSSLS